MGSELRFDYSVLGDTVNTASRLEGQTRTYGVHNVVGETTCRQAPELAFLELDLIRVMGKTIPVRVYTVVGDADFAGTDSFKALAASHTAMLESYRARNWDAALRAIDICRTRDPGLGLTRLYDLFAARIAEFTRAPPPPVWDSVYEATSKA